MIPMDFGKRLLKSSRGFSKTNIGSRSAKPDVRHAIAMGDSADGYVVVLIDGSEDHEDNYVRVVTDVPIVKDQRVTISFGDGTYKVQSVGQIVKRVEDAEGTMQALVLSVTEQFATTASPDVKPSEGDWGTDSPAWNDGETIYVWRRIITTYVGKPTEVSEPTCTLYGTGADGKSAYELAVEAGFRGTEAEWLESLIGQDGEDGLAGDTTYIHIAYATSANGDNFSTTHFDGATYLGTCTSLSEDDPENASEYEWALIKGADGRDGEDGQDGMSAYEVAKAAGFPGTEAEWLASLVGRDGEDGDPGTPGKDGKTPYLHIAYGTSLSGANFSVTYFDGATHMGTCTDYTQADPTTASSYDWALIKGADGRDGEDGDPGRDGRDGSDGQMLYATSNTGAGDQTKAATLTSGTITLASGVTVSVKFTNANTHAAPKLNVQSTGAKTVMLNGSNSAYWKAGDTVAFVYDGSNWQVCSTPIYGATATIGNPAGGNVYVDGDSMDIRKGTTVLATFTAKLVELGKDAADAIINLCKGAGLIQAWDSSDTAKGISVVGGSWNKPTVNLTDEGVGISAVNINEHPEDQYARLYLNTDGTVAMSGNPAGRPTWNGTNLATVNDISAAGAASAAKKLVSPFTGRQASPDLAVTGDDSVRKFVATATMTTNKPPTGDGHIMHFEWDNTGGYSTQLALKNNTGELAVRGMSATTWNAWRSVLDSVNFSSYALPLSGGTVSGKTTFTGGVDIRGNAGSQPFMVRGIVGSDGSGVVDALYLQYGANKAIHLGNGGSYTISADGGAYSGTAAKATADGNGNNIVSTYATKSEIPSTSNFMPKSGGTMTGELKTSFNGAVAMGSYQAGATNIPALLDEVRYSSGCMGSVDIHTSYTHSGVTIPNGWYNFVYSPHRSGGANGAANGDNINYGTLLLAGMTVSSGMYRIRYSGGISEVAKLLDTTGGRFTGPISFQASSLGDTGKALEFVCGIDAFAAGGQMGWQSKGEFLAGYATTAQLNSKMGALLANSYWGMTDPYSNDNVWIRTTTQGIIPYQSGVVGSGHQSIGTSSWYFSEAYVDTINCKKVQYTDSSNNLQIESNTSSSYTPMWVRGVKGGYGGALFGENNKGLHIMSSDPHQGLYNESTGKWIIHYNRGTGTVSLGTNDAGSANVNVSGTFFSSGKMYQGATSSDASIASMNRFEADLYVQGNGTAPNGPTVAGFYLGKSTSDENRHMDIVSGGDYSYIDFNKAGRGADYDVRLLVNVTNGYTDFCWGGGSTNPTFNVSGNLTVGGRAVATTSDIPNITYGTTDLTPGSSALAAGSIYLVYE